MDLPVGLRAGYIAQQMRLLARRAVLLIKYVDFEVYVFYLYPISSHVNRH